MGQKSKAGSSGDSFLAGALSALAKRVQTREAGYVFIGGFALAIVAPTVAIASEVIVQLAVILVMGILAFSAMVFISRQPRPAAPAEDRGVATAERLLEDRQRAAPTEDEYRASLKEAVKIR